MSGIEVRRLSALEARECIDELADVYNRLGWMRVGVIPNYALFPDGRMCDTTVFYKQLPAGA